MDKVYDVAIVGYGPCGAVAAGLLGGDGLKTFVCDKSVDIYDKPRAFALDHEIMRVFQQLGVHDAVLEFAEPFTPSEFYGVDGQLIKRFSSVDPPFPLSFPPSLVFNQPATERILRKHVATLPMVDVSLGTTVVDLRNDADAVTLFLQGADGTSSQIRARYVIGCDGASSPVRTMTGLTLKDLGFDQPWLVADVNVTDAGARKLPRVSVQFCEPARPTTYLVGPGNHRRWEISLNADDDPVLAAQPEMTWRLLSRWLTPDDGTLWRQASYRFHALVAERWRAGRVFIAGDAAHQQPPFLGQGMCQGVRDVANLAWKLRAVLEGGVTASRADALLDTYGEERRSHVEALTTRIKAIGELVGERDPARARARDAQLLAASNGVVQSVPRQDVQPRLVGGLLATRHGDAVGALFPQPWVHGSDRAGRRRMDDVSGRGWRIVVDSDSEDWAPGPVLPDGWALITLGRSPYLEDDEIVHRWFVRHQCRAAIVRPDHYVYSVASDPQELRDQCLALDAWLRAVAGS